MRHTTPTIVVAVALLAITGCSNTEPGKADAAPAPEVSTQPSENDTSPEESEAVPGYGAPKIDNPLELDAFQQAPCETLASDQVTEILGDGVAGQPDLSGTVGPTCQWAKSRSTAQVDLAFPDASDLGLTGIYKAKQSGKYGFLRELGSASGYPVIAYGYEDRSMSAGICGVRVGTSDRATIDIAISLSAENVGKTDPCEAGRDIAEMVIGNIKGGN